eukprot:NODE_319_length_9908_cov_1.288001.p7 type:complete len:230 gc:universal NODE_319_length_9908_cov_1.288001:129-818(+)
MRKNHEKEFNIVSTVLLMAFPLYFAIQLNFTRFITIWFLFATYNIIVFILVKKGYYFTPRLVFKMAMKEYQLCWGLGVFGYVLFFVSIFVPYAAKFTIDLSVHLLFYGLYFGVLCRDMFVLLQQSIHSVSDKKGDCWMCGIDYTDEEFVQLKCNHKLHEKCYKGWKMIGKKVSPCCKENIDLTDDDELIWEKHARLFASLIEYMRFILVWQPLLLVLTAIIYHLFYDDK